MLRRRLKCAPNVRRASTTAVIVSGETHKGRFFAFACANGQDIHKKRQCRQVGAAAPSSRTIWGKKARKGEMTHRKVAHGCAGEGVHTDAARKGAEDRQLRKGCAQDQDQNRRNEFEGEWLAAYCSGGMSLERGPGDAPLRPALRRRPPSSTSLQWRSRSRWPQWRLRQAPLRMRGLVASRLHFQPRQLQRGVPARIEERK